MPECFRREGEDAFRLFEMFVDTARAKGRRDRDPATRPVFRKQHGVAHAVFELVNDIPDEWRVGLFGHGRLDAWLRFSSDAAPTDPDLKSNLGLAIKLFGVPGEKALGGEGDTADIITQAFPVFFVDTAREMVEFTYAGVVLNDYPGYLRDHPKCDRLLKKMAKVQGSCLTTTYWGVLPFRLGDHIVKYRIDPETAPENVPDDARDYLATDLADRLRRREYRFTLSVQLHKDGMPLDKATEEWSVEESPYRPIATLTLPQQDVGASGQAEYGSALAFNIWRVPEDNAPPPESSIAEVRRAVYAASADVRHYGSGERIDDPVDPRPSFAPDPGKDDCIVKAVIYPPVGVARVGNSPDGYFIGPEVPHPPVEEPGFYRDEKGRLKRQAARFRIYGVNVRGEIVRELTGANSDVHIEWEVELANTKSAWYGFELALDIPEASSAPPTTLRNPSVADRSRLAITPGPRKVAGTDSEREAFDSGEFMGEKVYLGEMFTDAEGRLVLLGGHGKSRSYNGCRAITFANNEGWYDDVSDGPVTAKVEIGNQKLDVVPAWVIVAPPNYGPLRKSVRTMWDLMRDVAVTAGTLPRPVRPSFANDILPIFERMAGLQWVNAGFAAGFGWNGAFDLTSMAAIAKLGSTSPAYREMRKVMANNFRHFDVDGKSPVPWPWLYGDAMNVPPADTPRQNASLSNLQLWMLGKWAEGDFEADYESDAEPPRKIEDVPVAEQGDMLTRAAMDFCLADAFHPGCEMTWPVRTATMYMAPFRFKHVAEDWINPPLPSILGQGALSLPDGPLAAQQPGSITRWMAVPWQTDTASCKSGYTKSYDPYVPSFWPARVPNQVLAKQNYDIVMDKKRPMSEREAAFGNRASWSAPLGAGSYTQGINNMIYYFDQLGVVEARKGPNDTDRFPAHMEVEDEHRPVTTKEEREEMVLRFAARAFTTAPPAGPAATRFARLEEEPDWDLADTAKAKRFPDGLRR